MSTPFLVSYTLEDDNGNRATVPFYGIVSTDLLADILTTVNATASAVDAISGCKLVNQAVTIYPVLTTGLKTTPEAGIDIQQTGLFTFKMGGSAKSFSVDVPGISDTLRVGNEIDTAAGAVVSFIALMTATGGSTSFWNSIWSRGMESLRRARVTFRKYRRQTK